MKRTLIGALSALLLCACSPQVYSLYLDVRQPSKSGLELARKSMAIVYPDGENLTDSLFDRMTASAMARALDADYFDGEETVVLYRIPTPDSVSVDLMRTLVMDTNQDVVFLLSSRLDPNLSDAGRAPIQTSLNVYDSRGEDKVHKFKGSATLDPAALDEEAQKVGERIAGRFLSQWNTESFSFYYFDDFSSDTWDQAIKYIYAQKFSKAIDTWTGLLKGNELKKASASYNIAMAFYLMEDYEMAARWLDQADKLENLNLSAGLRKRINAHLEKMQK